MVKTDILLINPPYRSLKLHVFMPMGLGYVATILDHVGIRIKIHDMNITGATFKQVSDSVKNENIPVVGITGFITQIGHIVPLIKQIKADNPHVKIVAAGSLLNGVVDYIFGECPVDIVVKGDAEETVVALVAALLGGGAIPEFPGIAYRKGTDIVKIDGRGYTKDLNSLPMLNRDLFDVEKYIEYYFNSTVGTRTLEVIWTRGCPYSCVYCINSRNEGRYRMRSVDNVIAEVYELKQRYGINDVVFAAEAFTVNRSRTVELCGKLAPLGLSWTAVTRADLLDEELVREMGGGGCRQIFIGIEAGDNELLQKMNKKITIEKISNAIHMIRQNKIEVRGGFIAGLPWETPETLRKAKDFCIAHDMVYWPAFATPYPNTDLYDKIRHLIKDEKKYIYSITNHQQYLSYLINLTGMPKHRLMELVNRYSAESIVAFMRKKNKYLPGPLVYLGARILLYLYRKDMVLGMDFHSFFHKTLRNVYLKMVANLKKLRQKKLS